MKKYIKLIILLNVIGTYSCSKDNIIQDNKPPSPSLLYPELREMENMKH